MVPHFKKDIILRGRVVAPDGTAAERHVLVRDGWIVSVTRERPAHARDAVYVATGPDDWIFPGMINLHSHVKYNVLPLWSGAKGTGSAFKNRYEWRGIPSYQKDVTGRLYRLLEGRRKERRDLLTAFTELQSIVGGTTTVEADMDLDRVTIGREEPLLCRGTIRPDRLGYRKADPGQVLFVLEFFKPKGKGSAVPVAQPSIGKYTALRDKGRLAATLAHLAEGRHGLPGHLPSDEYSRNEFRAFLEHPAFADAARVRSSPLSLVHASGLDTGDARQLEFLSERGIGVVWSPVSNILLYGDTLDASALLQSGINVALGTDWSPSGSKHLWEEAKNARFLLQACGAMVTDVQVFQMATVNAARALGVDTLGRIGPGCAADLFILRSPVESDSAMEVFFKTTDKDVRAVLIAGRPVYGARELLTAFGLDEKRDLQPLPVKEGHAAADKVVHLPIASRIDLERAVDEIERELKAGSGDKGPLRRSNLLAMSDMPYQERLRTLRAQIVSLGWKAGVAMRRRRDLRRVAPDAVRVWRGFMAEGLALEEFLKKLGEVFIPSTPVFQGPLGLNAYLPALLPATKPKGLPDELALVFYESQETYADAIKTLAGRAYRDLHGPVFARQSRSAFPVPLNGPFKADQPYHLFSDHADWHEGLCRLLVGAPKKGQSGKDFLAAVEAFCRARQAKRPKGLDGAIVVATPAYAVYWEHWEEHREADDLLKRVLGSSVEVVMREHAKLRDRCPGLHVRSEGLSVKPGEFLKVSFRRRKQAEVPAS